MQNILVSQSKEVAQSKIHVGIIRQIQFHKRIDKAGKLLLQLKEIRLKFQ